MCVCGNSQVCQGCAGPTVVPGDGIAADHPMGEAHPGAGPWNGTATTVAALVLTVATALVLTIVACQVLVTTTTLLLVVLSVIAAAAVASLSMGTNQMTLHDAIPCR